MLDVLSGGLKTYPLAWTTFEEAKGQVNCNFRSKKENNNFPLIFFPIFNHKYPGPEPDPDSLEMQNPDPYPDPTQRIRIHNTVLKYKNINCNNKIIKRRGYGSRSIIHNT